MLKFVLPHAFAVFLLVFFITTNSRAENMSKQVSFNLQNQTIALNSGYTMPVVGLGTYSLLGDTYVESVSLALKNGYRLIDTAYIYHNESSVDEGIKKSGVPRKDIFIITKLYPNQYANASKAIEEALEKLDTDYIDLMLLHHPGTQHTDAYKAMERAVKEGKIRSLGLSNYYIKELMEFLPQVTIMPALVQNEIHPYYQDQEATKYIQSKGITVQAWYPLGGRGFTKPLLENKTIKEIAATHHKSPAQIILRWDLQNGVAVIPGSSNLAHIKENIDIFDFSLSEEEMKSIEKLNRNEKHDWY